jgi:hypothetical protein
LICLAIVWSINPAIGADDEVVRASHDFFENKIRPVLIKRCFKCHAGEKSEGKLRLDRREYVLRGGQSGRVVLPGDPNGSLLIRAIGRVDKDLQMPPDDDDKLTAGEIQNFVAWVKMGAPFPDGTDEPTVKPVNDLAKAREFWSLQPPKKLTPPKVEPQSWPRNPIDQFVLAKLQAADMKPSARADKRDLLRRVTYDLTGLPPTPQEMDAFLADSSSDAYANVVDRLLDSRQYGVHWARHWFDVARYGDTRWVGAGEDRRWPFAYTYRDWVIQALNEDMPYDRFVVLQLSADQTPNARPADQAALGFLTVGRWFTGQLPDIIDDQIDVVTRGLLGLSAQCARCHDHKFDPLSTQDYYSLYGLFAASRMPVDGNGILAELPEVTARPVDAATEKEIAALHGQVDEFLSARLEALQSKFRAPDKLREYFPVAGSILQKTDDEIRAFAKAEGIDDRLLLRWVRYLKRSVQQPDKKPHPIFAPWHLLAAIPATDFTAQAGAVIEKAKADKLNPHVAEMLTPAPKSLAELANRYVDLFTKYDGTEKSSEPDQEMLRQVLRGNDSPIQVRMNELGQFLPEVEIKQLVAMRRVILSKLAVLPEQADHFLTYQHEAAPLVTEINEFLHERRVDAAADVRSTEKIASYLLSAHEAKDFGFRQFRILARSRQLSQVILRRWVDYLQQRSQLNDPVFAAWRVFAAVDEKDFATQSAMLTEQARKASGNQAVAAAFATPPASLSEVAKRYADLLVQCNQSKPFSDADQEAIRQIAVAADSPLRYAPEDVVDHFTRKDLDQLRNKERNLARLYVESPGSPALAMALSESSSSYAQRVFVRGNEHNQGEVSHGGFLTVLSPEERHPFTQGRGRSELAQAITNPTNPLTARVIVNRVWQWHFGAGLVRTPSDFGTRGDAPTHPELLDWLANRFMSEGWSLKKLHRQILLSATWRQSSQDNPAYRNIDPENRLLWRMSRRRLSFEELRDSLLAVSGRLDPTIGGRPSDLVKNINRRRSVFGTVDRTALPGFYRYFDFPGADTHVSKRHETIVAQQALYLMNNSFVMEQASHVADRTLVVGRAEKERPSAEGKTTNPAARIDLLYRVILDRSPSAQERSLGLEFIKSGQAETPAAPAPAAPAPNVSETTESAPTVSPDPWRYGWGSYDEARQRVTDFSPFTFVVNNQWRGGPQEDDPELGHASLHARGGHAGVDNRLAVIRRWVAPRGGRLSIEGVVNCQANSTEPSGDGVRARVVSDRHGQLGVWLVHGTEERTDLPGITVETGDTIDFVVDARGRTRMGGFTWSPLLQMEENETTEKLVWDSAKDFKAATPVPPAFDVWQRYAQVLLESNEFMFLD